MDGYVELGGDVFLFNVGLVAHDFEEDLEFCEFAFVLENAGLMFVHVVQPNVNFK